MTTIFEHNLASLQAKNTLLAKELRSIPLTLESPTIESAAKPPLPPQNQNLIIIALGIGDGSFVQEVWKSHAPSKLIVIEPDIRRFAKALSFTDLSQELEHPHIQWIVGCPIHEMETKLFHSKSLLAARGYQLIPELQSYPANSQITLAIVNEIQRIVAHESLHLKTRLARATLVQSNIIHNLPSIVHALTPDALKDAAADLPAFIVAAGPSLDRNVKRLKSIGNNGVIICVDTALRTLQQNKIQPHAVVTNDPTPENAKHFDGLSLPPDILFAFALDVFHTIPTQFHAIKNKVCLFDSSNRLSYRLQEILEFATIVERPMNVSEAAIRLALLMGCNPIVLTGLDLAFGPELATTHSRSSSWSRTILHRTGQSVTIDTGQGNRQTVSICEVEGWNRKPLMTYPSFKLYLDELERIIETNPRKWYDATEGGARKRGCQPVRLKDAVEQLCNQPISFSWEFTGQTPSREQIQAIQKEIDHIHTFHRALQQAAMSEDENTHQTLWKQLLSDVTLQAFFDHAIYRFHLLEPVERFPSSQRKSLLKQYIVDAANTVKPLAEQLHAQKHELAKTTL